MFVSTLLAGLGGWIIGRFRAPRPGGPRLATAARWLAGTTAALNLAAIGGFALLLGEVFGGELSRLRLLLVLPIVSAGVTVALVPLAFLAWRRRLWSLLARVHFSLVAIAAAAFTWFVNVWNLFGFHC